MLNLFEEQLEKRFGRMEAWPSTKAFGHAFIHGLRSCIVINISRL